MCGGMGSMAKPNVHYPTGGAPQSWWPGQGGAQQNPFAGQLPAIFQQMQQRWPGNAQWQQLQQHPELMQAAGQMPIIGPMLQHMMPTPQPGQGQMPSGMAAGGRVITDKQGRRRKVSADHMVLTPEEVAMALSQGLDLKEYARNKRRMLQARGG